MGSVKGSRMMNFIVCTKTHNVFRVIQSRRLRWTGHVARMEEDSSAFKILKGKTYRNEAWSLTLKEECRLKVFEKRIQNRVFGANRDENREWSRLHNEELHSLNSSLNIVRVIKPRRLRWTDHVGRMEEVGVLSKF